MSVWNSPFEKYKIKKLTSKVGGFKVFLSNIPSEIIKIYHILWIESWFEMFTVCCRHKGSQFCKNLQIKLYLRFTHDPEASHFDSTRHIYLEWTDTCLWQTKERLQNYYRHIMNTIMGFGFVLIIKGIYFSYQVWAAATSFLFLHKFQAYAN